MRSRAGVVVASVGLLLLSACGGSDAEGNESEENSKFQNEPPSYDVVSQEEGEDGGTDYTVAVETPIDEVSTENLAAQLQADDDGLYSLTVVCASDEDDVLATARWAVGQDALEQADLEEGVIAAETEPNQICGDQPTG